MARGKKSTSAEPSSTRESESQKPELDLTYDEIIAICMAKFGMSYVEAQRCTSRQFEIEMTAYRLRRQETELNNRLNAYYTMVVQSTKGSGKSTTMLFKDFNDFYDASEEFEEALRPKAKEAKVNKRLSMAEINRMLNQQKGGTNE